MTSNSLCSLRQKFNILYDNWLITKNPKFVDEMQRLMNDI